jgi:cytochrome c
MFKHGTTSIGCEMCHVSHGSNAAMTAQFTSAAKFPDGTTAEDSALLKVNNRGTCNLCHEPTGTLNPGVPTGTQPTNITTPAVP